MHTVLAGTLAAWFQGTWLSLDSASSQLEFSFTFPSTQAEAHPRNLCTWLLPLSSTSLPCLDLPPSLYPHHTGRPGLHCLAGYQDHYESCSSLWNWWPSLVYFLFLFTSWWPCWTDRMVALCVCLYLPCQAFSSLKAEKGSWHRNSVCLLAGNL